MRRAILISATISALAAPAGAWWDEGHMQIAYAAYQQLDETVKEKVDALLQHNDDYRTWTAGWPDEKKKLYAFVHAATWADDIKMKAAYADDDATCPATPANIGYADLGRHACWHFKDMNFSPDNTHFPAPDPVDAVSQLNTFIQTLPELSHASPELRSYDLVWILHLVGDLHQPLHAVNRFTSQLPHGDRGGNAETVIPATGASIKLHFYWDAIFGGYSSPFGAEFDATHGPLHTAQVDPAAARISDPQKWADESADLARQFAYAPPIGAGGHAVELTRDYETAAHDLAVKRAALAAARLANLLNTALR